MAYKFSKGNRGLGDITFEDDADTGIDFDQDRIDLQTSGSTRLQVNNGGVDVTGDLSCSNEVQAVTGTFDVINLDRLTLTSSQTTVPPLRLIANSLQDNVGALRIDGSEPDIYLNQSGSAGFTTVTFAHNEQPMVGFGKNNAHNLYFFRETGQDGEPHTYVDTDFVFNRSSGDITMGQNLTVGGALRFEDVIMAELSIAGLDLQTDSNAFRFNCPYDLELTSMSLGLDNTASANNTTVNVTNSTDGTLITATISATNDSVVQSTVTSGSRSQGDDITFEITAAGTGAQGLRANLFFRRTI